MLFKRRPHGVTLVTILLMLTVFMVLATALVTLGSGALNSSYGQVQSDQALAAAESGAWWAAREVGRNPSWTPPPGPGPGGSYELPATGTRYVVNLFGPGSTPPHGGDVIPNRMAYIQSIGTSAGGKRKEVGILVKTGVGSLDFAALTQGNQRIGIGCVVNTAPGSPVPPSVAVNDGAATISGGGDVQGTAFAGPLAPPSSVTVSCNSKDSLVAPIPLPSVVLPRAPETGTNTIAGTVTADSNTYGRVVIPPGSRMVLDGNFSRDYVFQSLDMRSLLGSEGQLEVINPPVEVAIENSATFHGSLVNAGADPANLKFKIQGGQVDIGLFSATHACIYAPNSPIHFAGGHLIGNLIGRELDMDTTWLFIIPLAPSRLSYDARCSGAFSPGDGTTAMMLSYQIF